MLHIFLLIKNIGKTLKIQKVKERKELKQKLKINETEKRLKTKKQKNNLKKKIFLFKYKKEHMHDKEEILTQKGKCVLTAGEDVTKYNKVILDNTKVFIK